MTERQSTLTCPECAVRTTETMPTDACQYFYDCPGCGAVLKPLKGDCCVFCSYGDVPCPPIQEARATGTEGCCSPSMDLPMPDIDAAVAGEAANNSNVGAHQRASTARPLSR
jgi:hypothetical protein